MSFARVKKIIRENEANACVFPLQMKTLYRDGGTVWQLSFDKLVLYHNLVTQNDLDIDDSNCSFMLDYAAKTELDCPLHANLLQSVLQNSFADATFKVFVEQKWKTLPLPLVTIPIPYFQKAPNRVREKSSLATQPTRITIEITNPDKIKLEPEAFGQQLWDKLNEIACLHGDNYISAGNQPSVVVTQGLIPAKISQRASKNVLRWALSLVANLVPRSVAQYFPNFIKENARVYPYGYVQATAVMDQPIINSGILANSTNTALSILAVLAFFKAEKDAIAAAGKSDASAFGFVMGSNANSNGLGALVFAEGLGTAPTGTFANGYAQGLFFNNTMSAVTAAAENGIMPFATATVIREAADCWPRCISG
jgi:hypothetical protein